MLNKIFPGVDFSFLQKEEEILLEKIFLNIQNEELIKVFSKILKKGDLQEFKNYLWQQIKKGIQDGENNEKEKLDSIFNDL